MIQHRYVHQLTSRHKFTGHLNVTFRRNGITRWMIVRDHYRPRPFLHGMLKNEIRLQGHLISLPFGDLNGRCHHLIARAKHDNEKPLLLITVNFRHEQVVNIFRRMNVPRIIALAFNEFRIRATPSKFKCRNNAKGFCPSDAWYLLGDNLTIGRFRQRRQRAKRNQQPLCRFNSICPNDTYAKDYRKKRVLSNMTRADFAKQFTRLKVFG